MGTRRGEILSARAIADIDSFSDHGARAEGKEPLLSNTTVTDWAPQQEVLGFDLDTERMTMSLPARTVRELQELLGEGPAGMRTATVREVLALTGKLHHAEYVIIPARYFVQRLLQLSRLHLNGQERRRGGRARGDRLTRRQKLEGC